MRKLTLISISSATLLASFASAFHAASRSLLHPSAHHSLWNKQVPLHAASISTFVDDSSGKRTDPHVPIVQGTSSKAKRLRKQLHELSSNPDSSPIVLWGPKGAGKHSIVEELLQGLPSETVHRFALDDALQLPDLVFGTNDNTGLLDILANHTKDTVVFRCFESRTTANEDEFQRRQELERVITQLVTEGTFYSRKHNEEVTFAPRIIYTLHSYGKNLEPDFLKNIPHVLKVPSFQSRVQDVPLMASAKLGSLEKEYGLRDVELTHEADQRLLDHSWSGGEEELDQELHKALLRLTLDRQRHPYLVKVLNLPWFLDAQHMLVNTLQDNESMRRRLLFDFPILRDIINSPWIFDHFQRYIVAPVFIAFLVVLFGGPQTRDHNAALTMFWAGWWPAVMLSFPLLGRIWCSICPFMVFGNFAQEAVTAWGVQLKKWPKWVNTWGAPFAFGLFYAILVWEELWDLPENGALSAWLLLLITSGAVFNSVQFEKRMWCRHLCPIGAMCRVFGTMSMVEVRSFKANCQGCTNPQCVNGDSPVPDRSDNFALKGCTMDLKNNQLRDMGHCTLCMSCVKNCDKEVPEVNTRPIGIDYGLPWLLPPALQDPQNMAISQAETNFWIGGLLTVLQGSVLVHYLPRILYDFGMDPAIALAEPALDSTFYAHAAATIAVLALPGLLSLLVDEVAVPVENAFRSVRRSWGKQAATGQEERQMIIDIYESLLQSDKSLMDTLDELDPDGDGEISCWEFERALSHRQLPEGQCKGLTGLIRQRMIKRQNAESLPTEAFLDVFQQLYIEARGKDDSSRSKKLQLETKKSFVELFNELDKDGDGFIMPGEFDYLIDQTFQSQRSWEEKLELFRSASVVGQGRLNLFEFMTMMRKITQVGIQEIGYGYLPLAWASLTAYWVGFGMKELGLTLARAPDTFYLDRFFSSVNLPSVAASDSVVALVQAALMIGVLPFSIGLTQKLCDDNKIGGFRFGLHAAVQVVGAWTTLYLMLSPNPLFD